MEAAAVNQGSQSSPKVPKELQQLCSHRWSGSCQAVINFTHSYVPLDASVDVSLEPATWVMTL